MTDPHFVHPSERPNQHTIMLFSLVAGFVLLFAAGNVDDSDLIPILGTSAWLSFAIFLVTFGVHRMAWVLREHERWRESRAKIDG